jgi:peptidoglycan/xylan/chitin deacetylase (PgdA/CDA1 family)
MTQSSALYRPSILELARAGNFRAIAYWMNSLLSPYGIAIRVTASRSGRLNILIDFRQPEARSLYMGLRKQLVQFICYRLWTLNSAVIRDVRIMARIAGEADILWQDSIRITTLANTEQGLRSRPRSAKRHPVSRIGFQILRSAFVSRLAIAGFFLGYWMLYLELARYQTAELPADIATPVAVSGDVPNHLPGLEQTKTELTWQNATNGIQAGQPSQDAHPIFSVPKQFQAKIVYNVPQVGTEKLVALTFDDGPWPNTTEQVLDILNQYNVKATFFWIGKHIQRNPEIAQKVVAANHAVGNHTWSHLIDNMDEFTAAAEVSNAAKLIYKTTGVKTSLFRPPGGNLNGKLVPYAQAKKQAITMWTVDSEDYYVSSPIIVDNVLRNVKSGSIVLLHDGGGDRTSTIQALPQIITTLQRRGYRFVTVPELMQRQSQETLQSTASSPGG